MEEIGEIIEGLIKKDSDSIKEDVKELKEGVMVLEKIVNGSSIQLNYDEIILHVDALEINLSMIKEDMFKISVMDKIREEWKEITEEEELKKK